MFLPKDPRYGTNCTGVITSRLVNSNVDTLSDKNTCSDMIKTESSVRDGFYGCGAAVIKSVVYVLCDARSNTGSPLKILCKLDLHLFQFCELTKVTESSGVKLL